MINTIKGILLVGWFLFLFSCQEESQQPEVIPTDLTISVDVSDNGSGNVNVEASAVGALSYLVYFGESESEEPVLTNTGKVNYTYSQTGSYTIEVRAFGNTEQYSSITEEIQITVAGSGDPDQGYVSPEEYDGMTLVWRDEFNGNSLNTNDWTYEIGTGNNGWGNNELQYYREENTSVSDGYLTIEARNESFGGRTYTSSRIITQGNQSFQYGRIDIRARLPFGQGIWPALWMLGDSFSTVGWPRCGEIDIMELVGGSGDRNSTVHGTVHWDNNGSYASFGGDYTLDNGTFNDQFHVFSIIWEPNKITWLVDNVAYHEIDTSPAELDEFRQKYFFIFNVAVGGNWPGSPDGSTSFPQQMVVDYVRVFQND